MSEHDAYDLATGGWDWPETEPRRLAPEVLPPRPPVLFRTWWYLAALGSGIGALGVWLGAML